MSSHKIRIQSWKKNLGNQNNRCYFIIIIQNKEGEALKIKVNKYKEEVETYKARAKKAED